MNLSGAFFLSTFSVLLLIFPAAGYSAEPSLRILSKDLAMQTIYVSQELDNQRIEKKWIYNGRVYSLAEASEALRAGNAICSLWAFYFSDNKSDATPDSIKQKALSLNSIPLWKNVSGRMIFLDLESEYGLSYNCMHVDSSGQLAETTRLTVSELNAIFRGIVQIEEQLLSID